MHMKNTPVNRIGQHFTLLHSLDSVPFELRGLRQWVLWDIRTRHGKKTKVPLRPNGRGAKSNDPKTWINLDQAKAFIQVSEIRGRPLGLGFEFTTDGEYMGIDLDKCRDPASGVVAGWAQRIIDRMGSYAEVSPSGTGIKMICRARKPAGAKCKIAMGGDGAAIEIYDRGRFFTFTGWTLPGANGVRDCQAEVDSLCLELWPPAPPEPQRAARQAPATPTDASDAEVIERALRSRGKFPRLWAGDTSGHSNDASRADLALCGCLAFWCGPDPHRIDRLFRQSGLMRDKWEDRTDYRTATISKAIAGCKSFYRWEKKAVVRVVTTAPQTPSDKSDKAPPDTKCIHPLRGYFAGQGELAHKRLFGTHRCGKCAGCHKNWQRTLTLFYCNGAAPKFATAGQLYAAEISADDKAAVLRSVNRAKEKTGSGEYCIIQHPEGDRYTLIATAAFKGSMEVSAAEACEIGKQRFSAIEPHQRGKRQKTYTTSRGWKMDVKERKWSLLGRPMGDQPQDEAVKEKMAEMGATSINTFITPAGLSMTTCSIPEAWNDDGFMLAVGITPAWMLKPIRCGKRRASRTPEDWGSAAVRAKLSRGQLPFAIAP